MSFLDKFFGSHSKRELKFIEPIICEIEGFEEAYKALTDIELKGKTGVFKERLAEGEDLDSILPEAFAAVREAADRVLGMRPFRVQLIGAVVLHQGRISEMKTGEGKTLVAVLPAYLNALSGNGIHIVTVNDYLAKLGSEWMGKIFRFLGLSVGLIVHGMNEAEKTVAYRADITYGTNNEFGFDYLRDNMAIYRENLVQRGHNFAIVDEVDSILIDEARTPLIISGSSDKSTQLYEYADKFVKRLKPIKMVSMDDKASYEDLDADYIIDEKAKNAVLTKIGTEKVQQQFNVENLADAENLELSHHINQALKAYGTMSRDVDYVVKDGEVIIVDEFTGRLMYGRRYSQGLHQAIEAKEGVKVEKESKTLATITLQNYFRLYSKLSGMTGTAVTEEEEFRHIYKLDVIEVPTNKPMVRKDHPDVVFKSENGKYSAAIDQIVECHSKGQPVLVGTVSIDKSEHLSSLLKRKGVKHEVLNAKYHEKEAEIIAQAGRKGAVTIATNMAGRGTDIILGGNAEFSAKAAMRKKGYTDELIVEAIGFADTDNQEVLTARKEYIAFIEQFKNEFAEDAKAVIEVGGLFIIGTERHESRRIDNQLRGRAGRQGDPGESRFYLSLEDELMRLFGGDRVLNLMNTLRVDENMPIENGVLSNTIETAQGRIESVNFQRRKTVLQYDDVMNKQRELIYNQRRQVLNGENLKTAVLKMLDDNITETVSKFTTHSDIAEEWDIEGLRSAFEGLFLTSEDMQYSKDELNSFNKNTLIDLLTEKAHAVYDQREAENTPEVMREIERVIMLSVVDHRWMDHIDDMDELRDGIGLRAYGQKDPVQEYKFESYDMFENMINSIKEDTVKGIYGVRVSRDKPLKREKAAVETGESHGETGAVNRTVVKKNKVGRNDPCPCGSGKKYKKCCGLNE